MNYRGDKYRNSQSSNQGDISTQKYTRRFQRSNRKSLKAFSTSSNQDFTQNNYFKNSFLKPKIKDQNIQKNPQLIINQQLKCIHCQQLVKNNKYIINNGTNSNYPPKIQLSQLTLEKKSNSQQHDPILERSLGLNGLNSKIQNLILNNNFQHKQLQTSRDYNQNKQIPQKKQLNSLNKLRNSILVSRNNELQNQKTKFQSKIKQLKQDVIRLQQQNRILYQKSNSFKIIQESLYYTQNQLFEARQQIKRLYLELDVINRKYHKQIQNIIKLKDTQILQLKNKYSQNIVLLKETKQLYQETISKLKNKQGNQNINQQFTVRTNINFLNLDCDFSILSSQNSERDISFSQTKLLTQ